MGLAEWLRDSLTADARGSGVPDTSPPGHRPQWMRDGMRATEVAGRDELRVVGAPGHEDVLRTFVADHTAEPVRHDIHALLVAEHGATVAVWVGGHRIGRLSDDDAALMRAGLLRLQRRHRRAVALPGHVGGGRDSGLTVHLSYDAAAFGVRSRTRDGQRTP
jgi:hypothetical protein